MSREAHLVVLVENCTRGHSTLAEHGWSVWLDTGPLRMLFDTGQGFALPHNGPRLGIDLRNATAVALSHGHYDHAGGLRHALELARHAPLYAHPEAFCRRYSGVHAEHDVSLPDMTARWVDRRQPGWVRTDRPTEVADGVWLTGPIPRENDFEDTGGAFFLDEQATEPDSLPDDQAMFFDSEKGTVVVLGCAHAGVVNTLAYVQQLTGGDRIDLVVGGMHLLHADPRRLDCTLEALQRMGVQRVAPVHCTGELGVHAMRSAFGDRCLHAHVGSRFSFDRVER